MIPGILSWLTDGSHWSGSDGIPVRLLEHLEYSAMALLAAMVIGIPLGLYIGHTGRGRFLISVANALRAVPSLGLLYALTLISAAHIQGDLAFILPSLIALVLLAVPPVLAGAYSGVDEVDPAARDAAKGMGMSGGTILRKVEIPCSLPLLMSGVRSAALQVIATATIAASVSLGGLGRLLIDGLASQVYPEMAVGALLVAVLALIVDLLFALLQRRVVSPGLTGRYGRLDRERRGSGRRRSGGLPDAATAASETERPRERQPA